MPTKLHAKHIEGLLEVYEDMAEVLLALEIFFTKDSQVEDLLCGAPSCSEACVFFSNYRLRFRLLSAQYDLHHHFAWVADRSVVLILLHVAFLEKCVDQELIHHTSQERQPAAVPELPNDRPHQSLKQSHAEDHTEEIEATSGEAHH